MYPTTSQSIQFNSYHPVCFKPSPLKPEESQRKNRLPYSTLQHLALKSYNIKSISSAPTPGKESKYPSEESTASTSTAFVYSPSSKLRKIVDSGTAPFAPKESLNLTLTSLSMAF